MNKVEKFDRITVDFVEKNVLNAIKIALKDSGLDINHAGGKYNNQQFTLKIKFSTPITEIKTSIDQERINYGLAERGTKVFVQGREALIKGSRRKKYEFSFINEPNKIYLINFAGCRITS